MKKFSEWYYKNGYPDNISKMDFSYNNFWDMGLSNKHWGFVDFSYSDLNYTSHLYSTFTNCTFYKAKLAYGNFRNCVFVNCDFTKATFRYADFTGAKFENCTGLPTTEELLRNFGIEEDAENWYAYKAFGVWHDPPAHWDISVGSRLTDRVDTDVAETCSYGINVGTKLWVIENVLSYTREDQDIWRVRIPKDAVIIVPYTSEGKFRVSKCYLERIVEW